MMKLSFFVLFVAITFALSLEKKNQELSRTNGVLLQALRELTTSNEREVGNSQCDHITEDNKSYKCNGYYKKIVKCDICQDDDAGAVDNSKINDEIKKEEESVGFFGTYKCLARNDCISSCQDEDSSKTWYECMKECPKSLCDKDAESESMDPEDEEDDDSGEEEAVGLTCKIAGFAGDVTSDSWCDKRDGVWMHKCSSCRHGYYWYWWHTYCCTPGKSGCTCAYN
jgi:hypothetical protein